MSNVDNDGFGILIRVVQKIIDLLTLLQQSPNLSEIEGKLTATVDLLKEFCSNG